MTHISQPKGAWRDGPRLMVQITAPGSVSDNGRINLEDIRDLRVPRQSGIFPPTPGGAGTYLGTVGPVLGEEVDTPGAHFGQGLGSGAFESYLRPQHWVCQGPGFDQGTSRRR